MNKLLLSFIVLFSFALIACGPSRTQIQEMSSSCDALIEVRHVQMILLPFLLVIPVREHTANRP